MAYLPLARKYRPKTFEELVGQEGTAVALSNSIRLGREPHAVIFSGVRGIGKTTISRLYAKALNCIQGPTPQPCGSCEHCLAVESGCHEDVLEIDGASNTSVEDVRQLRETISYVPQRSKYKVYIIDEVHMLSQSAFNALLKTLEEPPEHVVFVFATTELQKIPQTILSRCQTFMLQRFSLHAITQRLKDILTQEEIPFEEKALSIVAREGRGSMRDALTFLDQVIALGNGNVSLDVLGQIIVHVSYGQYLELLTAMIARDSQACMELVERFDEAGSDMAGVCEELAKQARHAFILRDVGPNAVDFDVLGLDDGEKQSLAQITQHAAPLDLNRIFRTLVKCRADLVGSSLDRYVFENYILEWCLDPGLPTADEMLRSGGVAAAKGVPAQRPAKRNIAGKKLLDEIKQRSQHESKAVNELIRDPVVKQARQVVFPTDWRSLVDAWKQQKPMQARLLEEVFLDSYGPEKIAFAVDPEGIAGARLLQSDAKPKLAAAFKELFGFEGELSIRAAEKKTQDQPETLLDVKNREKLEAKRSMEKQLIEDPMTQDFMKTFDAKVQSVDVKI